MRGRVGAFWKVLWTRPGYRRRLRWPVVLVASGVALFAAAFGAVDALRSSFDDVFALVNTGTDVAVSRKAAPAGEATATVPADLIPRIRALAGAVGVIPFIKVEGARLIDGHGKAIRTVGSPMLGENWRGQTGPVRLRTGREPAANDEVVVNASLAAAAGVKVGDRVEVGTPRQAKGSFRLVGICEYLGGRDSLGGAYAVKFFEPVAQDLMLGERDAYTFIGVTAAPGVHSDELAERVRAIVGSGYEVKTNRQLRAEDGADVAGLLGAVRWVLLGLAIAVLLAGTWLMSRALASRVVPETTSARGTGAGRAAGRTLIRAAAIGLLASAIGLALSTGISPGLAYLFDAVADTSLRLPGVRMPASAVAGAFGSGLCAAILAATPVARYTRA